MNTINVGIIGCGNISGIYFKNLINTFKNTIVYACADIDAKKAAEASEKWDVPIMTVDEMLACDEIQIILNLTTPQSHFDVCKRALLAGKHVHVEKPLSLTYEQGKELAELATEKGLMLGCAPDTFLGAGIQTCRKLIEDDFIGHPIGATAFMMCHGHESWHPDPAFYYKKGGGPMFDMGPYYLTALVNLLGQVGEVSGVASTAFPTRTVTSEPRFGEVIEVETPTHVSAMLRFANGATGSIITSFDTWNSTLPRIEVYGERGTIIVPDPNGFGGPVMLSTLDGQGFKEIPLTHIYAENSRGIGVSDMANCIIENRLNNRASGALALHVLEVMCGVFISDSSKSVYIMESKYENTPPISTQLIHGMI